MYLAPVRASSFRRNFFQADEDNMIRFHAIVFDDHITQDNLEELFFRGLDIWQLELAGRPLFEPIPFESIFNDLPSSFSSERSQAKKIRLESLWELSQRSSCLTESIVPRLTNDFSSLIDRAGKTKFSDSLVPELERILSATSDEGIHRPAFPYFILSNQTSEFAEPAYCLAQALVSANRVGTSTLFYLDLDNLAGSVHIRHRESVLFLNRDLFEAFAGNTLVVSYGNFDKGHSTGYDFQNALNKLLSLAREYQHRVQIIFAIPAEKTELLKLIQRQLGSKSLVLPPDSSPDPHVDFQEALKYLQGRALSCGETNFSGLGVLLSEFGQDCSSHDLELVFNNWLSNRALAKLSPEYAQVLSSEPQFSISGGDAKEELDRLVGLKPVKSMIHLVIQRLEFARELSQRGLQVPEFNPHCAFLGNPGTGKTEVARIYGRLLRDSGFLSEGRVIELKPGNFNSLLSPDFEEMLKGNVVFIDEAYALSPLLVPKLLTLMENHRHESVFILAGYRESIEALMASNIGFASRVSNQIDFPDYSPEELSKIFESMVSSSGYLMSTGTISAVNDFLFRAGSPSDQGNARFCRNLVEKSISRQQQRLSRTKDLQIFSDEELMTLLPEDIGLAPLSSDLSEGDLGKDTTEPKVAESGREKLASLIGLEKTKLLVEQILAYAQVQRMRRERNLNHDFIPLHMAFKGNPGTGKTEVANCVAQILREEGILSRGKLFVCGRQDLVGSYVGHTAIKVTQLFEKAVGSVIFIDEAYSLLDATPGGYGDEAITTLIDLMEKHREEVVVILAGYPEPIDNLLASNPGFSSRVKHHVDFPDYSASELFEIFNLQLHQRHFSMDEECENAVWKVLDGQIGVKDFGNARFCRNLLENAIMAMSLRISKMDTPEDLSDEELSQLTATDIAEAASKVSHKKTKQKIGFSAN
ncbi:hypothetical protein BK816_06250 [Boudabousia tangfeifanii]|uniref:AAA+ ATPase domain-containing protein n=2 Tax=Boudabousia tangfeifanii TaxID=1912795 RepID=A0A1D9MKQ4_9ACTO|nr:hypothetical protein BK816_06250 [Boudabousia tangfeifanii]